MLHIENNRKRKLVFCYDVLIRVIRRERELNERREKKKRDKNAKNVKCKDVLRFICGLMKQG